MNAKRGYVPEDERNFSTTALETMRTASRHINYLINEGYSNRGPEEHNMRIEMGKKLQD